MRRGARPFPRTPVSMQPLSLGLPPSTINAAAAVTGAAPAAGSSSSPAPDQEHVPATLTWTPMRSQGGGMHPRGSPTALYGSTAGLGGGLKRARGPEGTPLLGAGLGSDARRRTRPRGEQQVLSTIPAAVPVS